jgi:hypothetical protein
MSLSGVEKRFLNEHQMDVFVLTGPNSISMLLSLKEDLNLARLLSGIISSSGMLEADGPNLCFIIK